MAVRGRAQTVVSFYVFLGKTDISRRLRQQIMFCVSDMYSLFFTASALAFLRRRDFFVFFSSSVFSGNFKIHFYMI